MNTCTPNLKGREIQQQETQDMPNCLILGYGTVWAGAGFENYNLLVEIQNTKSQSGHGLLDKAAYL